MSKWLISFVALALAFRLGLASPAVAGSSPGLSEEKAWSFQITPYVWTIGVDGKVRTLPGFPTTDVDADFVDILKALNFAIMVVGEVRWRRFGLVVDLNYASLSEKPSSGVEVDLDTLVSTIAASYRAVEDDRIDLDVLVGARVWSVDTELSFSTGPLSGVTVGESKTWVDPVVGALVRVQMGDGFFLTVYGDVGGFGAASDLTWQAFGGLGYRFNDRFSALVGYRYLDVDFEDGGFIYDVALHGPLLGLSVRF